MKLTPLRRVTLAAFALLATIARSHADISVGSGYSISTYYTNPGTDGIASFDWDPSSNLYYTTATSSSYSFGGLYQANFASPSSPTQLFAGNSNYAGASVVALGGYIYFNDGAENIYTYNPTTTLTTSTSAISNYALFKQGGQLYITGSGLSSNNAISYSAVGSGGALSAQTYFEQDSAYSGPLAFDSAGDLFYAPGYSPSGTNSIYEWTAAQVSAALADPTGHGLVIGNASSSQNASLWDAYGAIYSSYAGGTSLVIDNNQLMLTLTNFGGPSALVSFDMSTDGSFSGTSNLVLSDDASTGTSLGQLGLNDGTLYVADGSQILAVVPEPSTLFLLALGMAGLIWFRGRRANRSVPAAVLAFSTFFFR